MSRVRTPRVVALGGLLQRSWSALIGAWCGVNLSDVSRDPCSQRDTAHPPRPGSLPDNAPHTQSDDVDTRNICRSCRFTAHMPGRVGSGKTTLDLVPARTTRPAFKPTTSAPAGQQHAAAGPTESADSAETRSPGRVGSGSQHGLAVSTDQRPGRKQSLCRVGSGRERPTPWRKPAGSARCAVWIPGRVGSGSTRACANARRRSSFWSNDEISRARSRKGRAQANLR